MTIYAPLVSGVRGTRDDSPAGHLERRHAPFTHPMENAMSPDQFEQLKTYLGQMAAGFATKAEYEPVVQELNEHAEAASKRIIALEEQLKEAQARATEAEKALAVEKAEQEAKAESEKYSSHDSSHASHPKKKDKSGGAH